MPMDSDTAVEFQKRRAEIWAASKPWLFLMLIGFLGGFFVDRISALSPNAIWTASIVLFLVAGASIVRLVQIVNSNYRCPSCGAVPMSGWASLGPGSFGYEEGVDLSPSACPSCGVKLH